MSYIKGNIYDGVSVSVPETKQLDEESRHGGSFSKDYKSGERRKHLFHDENGGSGAHEGADNLVFNSNIVYVRGDSDALVSNGYYYAPYRTLDEALSACSDTRNTIMIMDNHTYTGDITLRHGSCENLIAPHAHIAGTVINDSEQATIKLASCNMLIMRKPAYVYIDDCNDYSMVADKILHGYIASDLYFRHSPTLVTKSKKQFSLTANTGQPISFTDLNIYFPFTLEFLKIEGSTATPVDIPYTFTSTGNFDWQITLNPTETATVLVMARG